MGVLAAMSRSELPLFLPDDKLAHSPHDISPRRGRWLRRTAWLTLALLLPVGYFQYGRHWCSSQPLEIMTTGIGLPKEVQRAWAAHSPYFPAAEYIAPPKQCEVVQV